MTQLIDIGANLTHESFADDLTDVIDNARAVGVSQFIVTGASTSGSQKACKLAETHQLFATAGIHPHHADETDAAALTELKDLLTHERVVAVGETGLDYFRNFSEKKDQIRSFEAHIELAIEADLPLFLHERDAYPDFADILRPYVNRLKRCVVHCFTGEKQALHAYLDMDCYIGMTGWICDERRGTHLIPLLRSIPADRLMIETDAPYLMPRNLKPKPKGRRNEPQYLPHICRFIAQHLDLHYEVLAAQTTSNASRFFGLPA